MKKVLLSLMLVCFAFLGVARAQELTVHDGTTTNSYVPVYGFYADAYLKCEMVYPADELLEMAGGTINSMTFYAYQSDVDWGTEYQVFVSEVSDATISAFAGPGTVIYEGALSIVGGQMVVNFATPYAYGGDNLLVGVYQTNTGDYISSSWYGESVTGASVSGYSYEGLDDIAASQRGFLPKTTFGFTPGEVSCAKPDTFEVTDITTNGATFTWTSEVGNYTFEYKMASETDWTVVTGLTTTTYTLNTLEPGTSYNARVKAICGTDSESFYKTANFKTLRAPKNLPYYYGFENADELENNWDVVASSTSTGITSATDAPEGSYVFVFHYSETGAYLISPEFNGTEQGLAVTFRYMNYSSTTSYTEQFQVGYTTDASAAPADFTYGEIINGENQWMAYENTFPANTKRIAIKYIYTDAYYLRLDDFAFELPNSCRIPTDFAVSEIGPHSVVLSWTENGEATEWNIDYISENDTVISSVIATTNPYTLTGLTPETMYAAQVTPVCLYDKPSEVVYWTTNEACPKPEVTVTPYPFSANVEWTGWGSDYELEWAEAPAAKDGGIWLQYDDDTHYTNIGNTDAAWRTWGVRYTKNDIQGNTTLTKVAFMESSYYSDTTSCIIRVYSGEEQPTTLLGTENVTANGTSGWHEVTLSTPITISPVESLWITLSVYGGYVMVACQVNNPDNQWWDTDADGEWTNMAVDNPNLAGYGWMIRGYVEGYNDMLYGWTSETGATSPYVIDGLEPSTNYVVRMRANCGADGESDWVWVYFTTPTACDAPVNLNAEVTSNSANLSWVGYQDDFELRYRKATKYETVWEDDFEEGLSNWTMVAGVNATYPASGIWYTINPMNGLSFESYSGTYCASSWSWNSSAYNADNWLITPQLDLKGTLKYYVRTNTGYPDSYEVKLSTTTNDTTAFTVELKAMDMAPALAQWNEVVIDLSAYEGQQGYIAIHHVGYDMNYLVIDKFGIYNIIEAGPWQVESLSDTNYELTGLTASTDYEWQVRGENRDCDEGEEDGFTDWSELATFTTLQAQGQTIALAAGANYVSFYVETTLNGVETALTDALGTSGVSMSIKSQTEYTEFKRGHWTTEIAFDVTQLFIISVSADCEIVVSGPAINPAEHEITIVQGANWISYPNAAPMLITPAFTGFVMPNDEITSQTDYAKFTRGKWTNEAMQLQPGQGYIYGSQQTGDRPFTFPTPAKVAPKSVSNGPAVQRMPRTTEMY